MTSRYPGTATDVEREPATADTEIIDLRRLLNFILRRIRLIIGVGLAVFTLVVLVSLLLPKMYSADAQVALNRSSDELVDVHQDPAPITPDSSSVDTEVQVLQSPQLSQKVIDRLHLDRDPEFNPELAPFNPITSTIGLIKGLIPKPPMTAAEKAAALRQSILDNFDKQLTVKRSGLTYAIDIVFTSQSSRTAALVANTLADQYLADQMTAKLQETQKANTWLSAHLEGMREQVQAAEARVADYQAAHGLQVTTQGDTYAGQEITTLADRLASARADEAEQTARLNAAQAQIEHGGAGADVGQALQSPVIVQLRSQRADLSRQVTDMQGRYGPLHPDLVKVRAQLADIDSQIHAEIDRIVSNLRAQAAAAHQRAVSLQGDVNQSRGQLASNGAAQVRLNELQRNLDSVKGLYQSFLDRAKQTSEAKGAEQPDSRLVAAAERPVKPSSPKMLLVLVGAIVLGGGAALAAAVIVEMLDTSLSTAMNVERLLGVPSLGGIPALASTLARGARAKRAAPADYVVTNPLSLFAESFRALRASIVNTPYGKPARIVMLTSALPGEGKSTTALCLARSTALSGGRVLLIDCDVRHPALSRMTVGAPKAGLIEVLAGKVKLADAMQRDERTTAMLLPVSEVAYVPNDLLGSAAMDTLLADLRSHFDMIILDSAPVLPAAETRLLALKADALVFLVRWRKTPATAANAALRLLEQTGAQITGACLTQVDMREQSRTGYGDAGFFYPAYRHYYS